MPSCIYSRVPHPDPRTRGCTMLRAWPVSRAVNDVRRDGPELLEPVA
jgi:putative SOS response-associated peptidase YedK